MVLRGREQLQQPAGDIDLLVAQGRGAEVERALTGTGFSRVAAAGHGSHRFWFSTAATGPLLKLDVVDRVEFGPYQQWRTDWAGEVLSARRTVADLPVPSAGDEAVLELLHLVLDKGEILPARTGRAVKAAQGVTPGVGLAATVDAFFGRQIVAQLVDLVQSGEFAAVPALRTELAGAWVGTTSVAIKVGHGVGRRRPPRLARAPRRGLTVAVLGPDGAGKTTLLHGLQADLPVPTRYRYQGLWSASRWDAMIRRIPGARLLQKLARIASGSIGARYHRARGRVVLLDRTALDALLPTGGDGRWGSRIIRYAAEKWTPDHDLVLVLDAPGAEMFRRKQEHSPQQLETWRQGYLTIAADLPQAVVLDATRSPEQVRLAAGRLVWHRLTEGGR